MLIADSGSTKTDWAWIENGTIVHRVTTAGINPVHQGEEDIEKVVEQLFPRKNTSLKWVFFYGAGCIPEKKGVVEKVLRKVFPDADRIEVESDLLGAARAVCQYQEGLACILGTGSNSCFYDGEKIVGNIPPLGYILGDEGSGAVLGKHFINYLFKGNSSHQLMKEFTEETGLTMTDIINKVYSEPLPNRFLASLAPFIHVHLDDLDVRNLVIDNFRMFFVRNIQHYQSPRLKVNAVGSIAYYFKDCLQEAAIQEGYELGIVLKSPMDGLIKYHQNNK